MLNRFTRVHSTRILTPVARLLLRLGVTPDQVTLVGTVGVSVGALAFYPRGELLWGTVFITCFVFSDLIDGAMARKSGRSSTFGSFWDSTLDRVGDAAIFGGLALYFAGDEGDSYLYLCLALFCLVTGNLTSYARAKAESLGLDARGGIAERSDRLVAILLGLGFTGLLDVPWLVEGVLWVLAAASAYTVVFRVLKVRRQAIALDRSPVVPE
jgi:CDP-diacylglycerol--glycerol-3-phosphate 3-phosphatidyltransferase/CDP-diacylglycerol--inositol 3-phosphatidyltransferase